MENVAKSLQRLTQSSATLTEAAREAARITELAAQRTRLMLGCFRRGEANDPATFVAAITATLSRYPDAVILAVTDPATGMPARSDWLPTVREVRDYCEDVWEPIREQAAREKRIAEQLAARDAPEPPKPTLADLKAKYGENWGLDGPKTAKTLEERKAETEAALERQSKEVDAEYAAAGLVKPSRFALSLTARKEMAERDELRERYKTAAE